MGRAGPGPRAMGDDRMIVLGIETATPQTSLALGTDAGLLAALQLSGQLRHPTGKARRDPVTPALEQLLAWTGLELAQVRGVAVGLGPGLFTSLRVGVETAKTLAQVLSVPIVGIPSLDVLAFGVRHSARQLCSVIDARRGEVFFAFYRGVPGGLVRESEYRVASPAHLAAELAAVTGEVLLVGNGAILYRHELEEVGARVEVASSAVAFPQASALVELAIPRFVREEWDRLFELVPLYLRRSDAEIAWDQRARGASA